MSLSVSSQTYRRTTGSHLEQHEPHDSAGCWGRA
jgi:hypothetical protein